VIFFVYFHYNLNILGSAVLPLGVTSFLLIHKLLFAKKERKEERKKKRKKERKKNTIHLNCHISVML